MAIGYLQIQVRTAQGAIPLEGALIWVLDNEGNALYHLVTDESGDTRRVSLETLDRSFSQSPYYLGKPYADYGVMVELEGFEPIRVTQIPIYEGETATLPVMLMPLKERGEDRATETKGAGGARAMETKGTERACTTESKGTGKSLAMETRSAGGARSLETRGMVRSLSIGGPAVGFPARRDQEGVEDARILRQVVIPDPITVHLGFPDSAAANVRVPFLDYVKNAASSEIYPTWPEAALKANIYAIMTFALNRVYTEWYRGRGYDFDITNQTAYDQAYVFGRPIYDSISKAVDEIYGEYVKRQGQNAPYFTSFCNGTTVTCGGLSQWGTVDLADRGYSPERILRYYYPDDIEIARTNIVTNALASYPGAALGMGSKGLDVQTIQAYLGRIRRNYPAIPAITDPSGTFGETTLAAVRKFQSVFGLTPDGIVGKATWYKLSNVYAAVTRLAELDSEGSSLGIGTIPPNAVLRQGSRGQDVVTLQYLLNVMAQYNSDVPAPVQDGIFGNETGRAAVAFQRLSGLVPDGIVGPKTWQALYDRYLGILENVPMPGPGAGTILYMVQPGDTLWLLSRRYKTTVEAIKQANGLSSNILQIGQVLRIPLG